MNVVTAAMTVLIRPIATIVSTSVNPLSSHARRGGWFGT
jgi:hypothetical protein